MTASFKKSKPCMKSSGEGPVLSTVANTSTNNSPIDHHCLRGSTATRCESSDAGNVHATGAHWRAKAVFSLAFAIRTAVRARRVRRGEQILRVSRCPEQSASIQTSAVVQDAPTALRGQMETGQEGARVRREQRGEGE